MWNTVWTMHHAIDCSKCLLNETLFMMSWSSKWNEMIFERPLRYYKESMMAKELQNHRNRNMLLLKMFCGFCVSVHRAIIECMHISVHWMVNTITRNKHETWFIDVVVKLALSSKCIFVQCKIPKYFYLFTSAIWTIVSWLYMLYNRPYNYGICDNKELKI